MKDSVKNYVRRLRKDRSRRRKVMATLLILSLVVAGGVTWSLHLTGESMTGNTWCGQEEQDGHVHSLACYSNPKADVETVDEWEASLPKDGDRTGNWSEDLVTVAKSQLGYTESTANYQVAKDGETKMGWTRYGAWYGDAYKDWNSFFAGFCIHYANIDEKALPYKEDCAEWVQTLQKAELYVSGTDDQIQEGDILFFDTNGDGTADRVGIVSGITKDSHIKVIEGDSDGQVKENTYALSDQTLTGYVDQTAVYDRAAALGLVKEEQAQQNSQQETDGSQAEITTGGTDETSDAPVEGQDFTYENDNYRMNLHLEGTAEQISEVEAQETDSSETTSEITLETEELGSDSEEYGKLETGAKEQSGEAEIYSLTGMKFHFFSEGQELDVSDCMLTAEITPKETILPETQEGDTDAAETGAELTALEEDGEQLVALDTLELSADAESLQPMTVSLKADSILALSASENANPQFTVQYYAYVDTVSTDSTENALTVIDTSGGQLPVNGVTPATKALPLEQTTGDRYIVATEDALSEVYTAHSYEFSKANEMQYIDRLAKNSNYSIKEIWVLKDGGSKDSKDKSDWDVYSSDAVFTNNSSEADENTILIKDNAVIRLVYYETDGAYTNAVTFYDYDITDGKLYKSAEKNKNNTYDTQAAANGQTVYAYTNKQGINKKNNYSGKGAKLAFGNSNTESGLGNETWSGNALNRDNGKGYKGCTFGLVTGLDANTGYIQYASGVSAPKLFDEGKANGKTVFNDYGLNFTRSGDTYTLSSVKGAGNSASDLDKFTHITKYAGGSKGNIFTNLFWPMDSAETFGEKGHDLKFGQYRIRENRKYFGNDVGNFPTVDENITHDVDHNSYFGMQYAVQFDLSEDYVGPLEYYFFGDDDMWVFLDGKLVCDIGGVHSSVGEYVNLWDYIEKGSSGTHTLSFFYTERGASGSSCYMRFTLPSVSSITPEQSTGSLRVEKAVKKTETESEFTFRLDLSGEGKNNSYTITRYDADNNIVGESSTITTGDSFTLKKDEHAVISGLPVGIGYTVTETGDIPYETTVNGKTSDDREASGTISSAISAETVRYVNTAAYALPETGGSGIQPYVYIGLLLLAAPVVYGYGRRRMRRRRRM